MNNVFNGKRTINFWKKHCRLSNEYHSNVVFCVKSVIRRCNLLLTWHTLNANCYDKCIKCCWKGIHKGGDSILPEYAQFLSGEATTCSQFKYYATHSAISAPVIVALMVLHKTNVFTMLTYRLFRCRSKKTISSASLAFVRGIHWWPVVSLHKGSVK